ncbi:MAG: Ig-like domain-containing protein, partial [Cyclobacteriaceae bacterium]
LVVNPFVDGLVVVLYTNNIFFDLAGNGNDSSAFSIEYDATPPVLSMTSEAEEYINSSFEISVAFNEEVDNIEEHDIRLINATLSDFLVGEGSASFLVNPLVDGEVLVYYPDNQVFDLAGNGNDSSAFSIEFDTTPPAISMTSDVEEYINSSFEITVAFSEEVDNIDEHDVRLINATLSDFLVDEGLASFLVNPLEEGEVLVYYPNNQVFDLAGNGNDSTSLAMIYDVTPPMLNTEIKSGDLTAENFEIYLKFSEFVTDFNESDISLKNLTLTNLIKENDSLYSITLERVQFGEIVLRIESDSYLDRAGNWNVEIHEITELILKTSEIVDQIKAYPVPSNGFLDIHSQIKSISEIAMTIYSIGGKIISEGKVLNGRNSYDLRSLDDGIYFIHFEYNGKTQIQKIIIKK